jgi:hypothetical protein
MFDADKIPVEFDDLFLLLVSQGCIGALSPVLGAPLNTAISQARQAHPLNLQGHHTAMDGDRQKTK